MLLFRTLPVLFAFLLVIECAPNKQRGNDSIIVKTKSGEIEGIAEHTILDRREFYSFRGIPYAQPPIGELRFKAPQKVEPWTGILNRTDITTTCLQTSFNLTQFYGEENCLFLNVFTPNLTPTEKLPVLFFIHGGGYMSGSSNWVGPELLLDEDIILVTINYRVGPFGFLSLNTAEYSGNMGLKDQLQALRWVNENIDHFGGDANKITIFGQSAGAAAVHLHMLIPAARNLFQRAIASSGSMLNPWSYSKKNHTQIVGKLVARDKGIPENDVSINDIIDWLSTVDGAKFGEETFSPVYTSGKSIKEIDLVWAPVIEHKSHDRAILTKPIESYFKEKTNIDSLFGYTSAESIILAPIDINHPEGLKTFDERFEIQLPLIDLNYSYFSKEYDDMAKDVRKFYFGDKTINRDSLTQFVKLLSDVFFIYGIDKSAKVQAVRSSGKTYYYQFSAELELNYLRKTANASAYGLSGATHIEDLLYLFNLNVFVPDAHVYDNLKANSKEGQMIKSLTKFFANFVRYGNPTPNNDPVEVKPIQNNVTNYVDITNNGFIPSVNPHAEFIQFWDQFLDKHKDLLGNCSQNL